MNKDLEDKEYREAFVEEFIRTGIAFQIRALRRRENWSQAELGQKANGTPQNVISRLEDPDYGSFTISTLLKLASAFDVGLMVRFVSFGDLWRASQRLSPQELTVARYSDETNANASSSVGMCSHTETPVLEKRDTGGVGELAAAQTLLPRVVIRNSSSFFVTNLPDECAGHLNG